MGIIVSLTSYPPRIGGVHEVIKSLYRQTVQADKIVLYLSLEEFPAAEAALPANLKELVGVNGFEVAWVLENLRSHKKYYYALRQYSEDIVITVDDDTLYGETMIKDLTESYQRFPGAVSARKARIMLKDGEKMERYRNWDEHLDEYAGIPRMDLCAIGVGGILYPPAPLKDALFQKDYIVTVSPGQDDLWLKYNEILSGIPVVYVKPTGTDHTVGNSQENRLSRYNYTEGNDLCVNRIMALFKEDKAYQAWFQSLMRRDDYITQKKMHYRHVFKEDFDRAGVDRIYLYGAGRTAKMYLQILADLRLAERISSVIVSDAEENPPSLEGIRVTEFGKADLNEKTGIIFGVGKANRDEIQGMLQGYAFKWIELDMRGIQRYYRDI